jgi:hypothetical protein
MDMDLPPGGHRGIVALFSTSQYFLFNFTVLLACRLPMTAAQAANDD